MAERPYIVGTCKIDGKQVAVEVGSLTIPQITDALNTRETRDFIWCGNWRHSPQGTLAQEFTWRLPQIGATSSVSS